MSEDDAHDESGREQVPGVDRFSVAVLVCLRDINYELQDLRELFDRDIRNAILYGEELVIFPYVQTPAPVGAAFVDADTVPSFLELKREGVPYVSGVKEVAGTGRGTGFGFYKGEDGKITSSVVALEPEIVEYSLHRCQAKIQSPEPSTPPLRWEPLRAVRELEVALQQICLPEISYLPVGEVMEIREKTAHLLVPVRAELLRLTKELRRQVNAGWGEGIQREAAHLVQTDIVPLVLEASSLVESEMSKKYRQFAVKAGKALGVIGLGFLIPDPTRILPKAIEYAADMASEARDIRKRPDLPEKTAQFVLEVGHLAQDVKPK